MGRRRMKNYNPMAIAESPMTAPDSRYLDEAMARLAEAVAQPVGGSIVISTADACAIGNELRHLQALARGPQRAGGEDAKDAARYRWIRACDSAGEQLVMTADGRELKMGHDLDTAIDAALNGGQDDA